ncbi:MAG: helix-turn-helix domain-containing protein [Treponema sp.]|jgi:transcriptional regulator with XRE-family HTH domain|nr:helix-turn-helix domain-containing protein [Treponema sp.]
MAKVVDAGEREIRQTLGLNMKLFRNRKGFSQAVVAEKIGMSICYLSDIENGKGWVSSASLSKIARTLDVEVFELFKPQKSGTKNAVLAVNKCLDDVSGSVKKAVEKSIDDTIRKIRKTYI